MVRRRAGAAVVAIAMVAVGCTTTPGTSSAPSSSSAPTTSSAPTASDAPTTSAAPTIGEGEGELNLIIWAGYAERGEVDPNFDWVTPFEEETGCQVNATEMTDSNNGV